MDEIKEPISQIVTLIKNKQYLSIVTEFGTILKNVVSNLKNLPSQLSVKLYIFYICFYICKFIILS